VKADFFKFPSTPHLAVLGDIDLRGDKVMSELEMNSFLAHDVTVEEKIDGANLGISFDSEGNIKLQNRGAYLSFPPAGQWKKIVEWIAPKLDIFFEYLLDEYILFGEWCYARHSVLYDSLPDWFLCFDIFDTINRRFLSCKKRDAFFSKLNVAQVPKVAHGRFTLDELTNLLSQSQVSSQSAEGLYLRIDQGDWLLQRAKLVRPTFIQSISLHWQKSKMQLNHLKRL